MYFFIEISFINQHVDMIMDKIWTFTLLSSLVKDPYLADELRAPPVGDVILSDISVQPVAEVQKAVIER